jgi:hypothetical protein
MFKGDEALVRLTGEDVGTVERVLDEAGTEGRTRDWLLKRAVLGAAAVGALGPVGSAVAATRRTEADTVNSVVTTAITAEALAVTVLTEAAKRVAGTPAVPFVPIVKAANTSEFLHYAALRKLGGRPLTTRFWIPEAIFGDKLANIFRSQEAADTLFINAYLVGITVFARANKPTLARYAGEILGVEAEHRVLARYARGQLEPAGTVQVPNNQGFETYRLKTTAQHVAALQKLGIGFGREGAKPGRFYDFPGDPRKNGTGSSLIAPLPA